MSDGTCADAKCVTSQNVDGALAQRLREHPAETCEELYSRFASGMYWFILVQLRGDTETAKDLVVETLADAVRDIGRFDARRATLSAWLHGIARRRVHMELHRRNRHKSVPAALQVSTDVVRESSNGQDIASVTVARVDAQRQVAGLAHVLSDLEMAALVLSYVEEFSVREIGRMIGRSERAVDSILHRAKRKARDKLRDYND